MTKTLNDAVSLGQYQTQTQTQNQLQPQPMPQTQNSTPGLHPPDPTLSYSNPEEYNRQLRAWQHAETQNYFQTASAPFLHGQIELAKAESRRDSRFKEVWERYGPEIESKVAHLPPQTKTTVTFWNDVAALVKGHRSEDIFKDRLAAERGNDTGTLGTSGVNGSGSAPSTLSPIAKAWADDAPWIQRFKRLQGMTLAKLQHQIATMGWTEQDYVAKNEKKSNLFVYARDNGRTEGVTL